jgi:lycopene cyclase domain-containing protein
MTFLVLALVVLALVAAACLPVLRRLAFRPILWTAVATTLLTALFDSALVEHGLTVYDPRHVLGIAILSAPVEDFAYTLAAVLLMPALWTAFGGREPAPVETPC